MPPPIMPYLPDDTDPDEDAPRTADASHQPRDIHWPGKANPQPPLTLVSAEGRFPHRGGILRMEDLHVQIESGWLPGVVLVRLDLEGEDRSDFWAQLGFRITPPADDQAAIARTADDGNPHAG